MFELSGEAIYITTASYFTAVNTEFCPKTDTPQVTLSGFCFPLLFISQAKRLMTKPIFDI